MGKIETITVLCGVPHVHVTNCEVMMTRTLNSAGVWILSQGEGFHHTICSHSITHPGEYLLRPDCRAMSIACMMLIPTCQRLL